MMKSVAAETGHLSGWHCDNFMADAYGCDTEYDDGEECPDFESKRQVNHVEDFYRIR